MNLLEKYKVYLFGLLSLVVVVLLLIWIGEIILPFILAIFLAYLVNPTILRIQTKIKNRNLAISSLLLVVTVLFLGVSFFFGSHIVRDSQRLVNGVQVFVKQNDKEIKNVKKKVLGFVDEVSENETFKTQIGNLDSLARSGGELDVVSSIKSVYSFFGSEEETPEVPEEKSWSPLFMIFYTLMYTGFILFTFKYFEDNLNKYIGNRKLTNNRIDGVWLDFKNVFIVYFKQRSKVIILNLILLILAFTLLDLPGAIIIGIITALLSYGSHFHYFSLPLVAIGCWVLSIENGHSFFLYFGIVLVIFIIISILEETLYFDKIMNSVNGMNPAIMLLSFTLWISIFGGFVGTIIALPLTQLILIFTDRMILYTKENKLLE